jgi:hypothetical protein
MVSLAQTSECLIYGTITKPVANCKLYLSTGNETIDSAIIKDSSFFFKIILTNNSIAEIRSELSFVFGVKSMRTEAFCYISPGRINILISELSDVNPVYSFTVQGSLLATEYENKLRKPVFQYNTIIHEIKDKMNKRKESNEDISLLQEQFKNFMALCFGIPKKYIMENPDSELSIVALKMMGKGDPSITNGSEELVKLFASLRAEIKNSKAGIEFGKKLGITN